MSQFPKHSAPELAYADGLEALSSFPAPVEQPGLHTCPPVAPDDGQLHQSHETEKHKTIFGLRQTIFWLLLLLLAVVIFAAIGGGVGGTIAVQKERSKAQAAAQEAARTAVFSQPLRPSTSTATSQTGSMSSANPTPTTIYAPPAIETTLRVNNSCDASNQIRVNVERVNYNFICRPQTDAGRNDIIAIVAFTLQHCVEACAKYNAIQKTNSCLGVSFSEYLSDYYRRMDANCWLKSDVSRRYQNNDWVLVSLVT
ncbi:hypothetical protein BKA63DRAFT_596123 [Paraphoma chrysanthemicola]|nr:hypothetical protein BKA63DRAFT_596123 [Paraphoma chrysanthemicola]